MANSPFVRSYSRVRVEVDIHAALKLGFRMKRGDMEPAWIEFRYERLLGFCSLCGFIGHDKKTCPTYTHVDGGPEPFIAIRAGNSQSESAPSSPVAISKEGERNLATDSLNARPQKRGTTTDHVRKVPFGRWRQVNSQRNELASLLATNKSQIPISKEEGSTAEVKGQIGDKKEDENNATSLPDLLIGLEGNISADDLANIKSGPNEKPNAVEEQAGHKRKAISLDSDPNRQLSHSFTAVNKSSLPPVICEDSKIVNSQLALFDSPPTPQLYFKKFRRWKAEARAVKITPPGITGDSDSTTFSGKTSNELLTTDCEAAAGPQQPPESC
jgi:hypothetical protein